MEPDLEGVARGASTITDVLSGFEAAGFNGQFVVRDQGALECVSCHTRSTAGAVEVRGLRRLEGASDPDDMLAVAALVCPSCGTRGTVVLGYGPSATVEDDTVLTRLEPAPAPAPGEVEQPD